MCCPLSLEADILNISIMIQICSGIASGKSAQWRALCTEITEVYLCAFPYRLFHDDFSPMQPATIDPTLDLCARYPLRLGEPRQCGI